MTRRAFLGAVSAGTAWIALGGALGCEPASRTRATASPDGTGPARTFRSRPDMRPPTVTVNTQPNGTASGYIFVAPKKGPGEHAPTQDAPMIVDESGHLVWFHPLHGDEKDAFNLRVQTYRGEPVLTWWEGYHTGYGQGEYVIFDGSYREITRFRAGNGYEGDHHEFLITPQDTALITIYNKVPRDLSAVGGSADGSVLDGIAQEVDIATGKVLFEWHSLDHVRIDDSYRSPPDNPKAAFDYFHINSIDVDLDDNLLISSRMTSTVFKVDRKSGEVLWRLGGKRSDFDMGEGTRTDWQHDARRQSDGTLTIFDNGSMTKDVQSRGIVLQLDEDAMTATLLREFTHPDEIFAGTQGNVQVLPNGNVFIGWGSAPYFSEFSHDGAMIFNASFPSDVESYRAFRCRWTGRPVDEPALVAERGSSNEVTLYTSWNGATEVATWEILAGPGPDQLEPAGSASSKGFETDITAHTDEAYVSVRARDGSGRVLGTAKAIKPAGGGSSASTTGTGAS